MSFVQEINVALTEGFHLKMDLPPRTTPQVLVFIGCEDKGWDLSLQEGVSHTYTLKLGYSIIFILYKKIYIYIYKIKIIMNFYYISFIMDIN